MQSGNNRGKVTLGNKTHGQTKVQSGKRIFNGLPISGYRRWGIKVSGNIKPWTCANAQFRVVPPRVCIIGPIFFIADNR